MFKMGRALACVGFLVAATAAITGTSDAASQIKGEPPAGPVVRRSPGTEKMVRLLDEVAKKTDITANSFVNGERVRMIRSLPEPTDNVSNQVKYLVMLGSELLLAGEIEVTENLTERFLFHWSVPRVTGRWR